MLFNSFEFLLFLPVVFLLYWFVFNKKLNLQNLLLLVSSYIFYGWWDYRFLSLIIFSSIIDFYCGLSIEKAHTKTTKKKWLLLSMFINLGFLGIFKYFHFKSIIRRTSKMYKDGWLEESNLTKDSITLNRWQQKQLTLYTDYSIRWKKSEFRLKSLEKLITYLKKHGQVILLRMPIAKNIIDIENKYWKDFDSDISEISTTTNIDYFNFVKMSKKYKFYDGNHLDKYGGVSFTEELCDSIAINYNLK